MKTFFLVVRSFVLTFNISTALKVSWSAARAVVRFTNHPALNVISVFISWQLLSLSRAASFEVMCVINAAMSSFDIWNFTAEAGIFSIRENDLKESNISRFPKIRFISFG
ncbi:hypothetical protein EDD18DRAFT_735843 [Armillaria luteobubalina]|uniref:Uncharacterized protein n=1 Tax=Armillaria luteobubalina TaxID=153913 RepID=A0AA39QGT4_9AGAR|nr:hypothetical protein EDD18DRAFT_735843 [Armillaria luteobubalina]